jgi:hypothetical protein
MENLYLQAKMPPTGETSPRNHSPQGADNCLGKKIVPEPKLRHSLSFGSTSTIGIEPTKTPEADTGHPVSVPGEILLDVTSAPFGCAISFESHEKSQCNQEPNTI